MQIARSLVIFPSSIVSIQALSRVSANLRIIFILLFFSHCQLTSSILHFHPTFLYDEVLSTKRRSMQRGSSRWDYPESGPFYQYLTTVYLLMFSVVASNGTMSSLSFDSLSIGTHEYGGHQTKGTVACKEERSDYKLHPSIEP